MIIKTGKLIQWVTRTQTRCFCHVQDVVDAVKRLMDCSPAVGQVFNLGGTEEVSINDLARRRVRYASSKASPGSHSRQVNHAGSSS